MYNDVYLFYTGYLKLWQLQKPVLKDYDVIFIDEAQDCTPGTFWGSPLHVFRQLESVHLSLNHYVLFCMYISLVIMDILLSQSCGKILVGDPHQQIYTFRGAVNALHTVPHTHLYYLTQVHTHIRASMHPLGLGLSFCKSEQPFIFSS